MAFLGGLGGALVSSAAGIFSANRANQQNVTNFQNRHQWEVEDLKKAGLNPVLSANNGGSVASAPMANIPNLGDTINSGKSIDNQGKAIKSQVGVNDSVVKLNKELEYKAMNDGLASSAIAQKSMTDNAIGRYNLDNLQPLYKKAAEADIDIKQKTSDFLLAQSSNQIAQASNAYAQAESANAVAENVRANIPKSKASGDIYKEHPWLSYSDKLVEYGSAISGSFKNFTMGNAYR